MKRKTKKQKMTNIVTRGMITKALQKLEAISLSVYISIVLNVKYLALKNVILKVSLILCGVLKLVRLVRATFNAQLFRTCITPDVIPLM